MPKIIFSKPAQQDLFKIWDYIAIGDFDAADKVVRNRRKVFNAIC